VAAWNLTILGDQQLAGLIMWIPTGVVYLLTALILLVLWLQDIERRQAQRERVALG
jgi:cytochrome c oxidase assembly factor CtaG